MSVFGKKVGNILVKGIIDPKSRKTSLVMVEWIAQEALKVNGGRVVIDGVAYTTKDQMVDHLLELMKLDPSLRS